MLGVADAGNGVFELISDFSPDAEGEFAMVRRLVEPSGRPLSLSLAQGHERPDAWRDLLGQIERASADGLPIRAQVAPRPVGLLLGLQSSIHPFSGHAVFAEVPDSRSPKRCARCATRPSGPACSRSDEAREGAPGGGLVDPSRMFPLGDSAELRAVARDERAAPGRGPRRRPGRAHLRPAAGERRARLPARPFPNYAEGNLDACGEMLAHPDSLFGLGDGGAHVGIISDASFPTWFLSHWARDRSHGRMPVGRGRRAG